MKATRQQRRQENRKIAKSQPWIELAKMLSMIQIGQEALFRTLLSQKVITAEEFQAQRAAVINDMNALPKKDKP